MLALLPCFRLNIMHIRHTIRPDVFLHHPRPAPPPSLAQYMSLPIQSCVYRRHPVPQPPFPHHRTHDPGPQRKERPDDREHDDAPGGDAEDVGHELAGAARGVEEWVGCVAEDVSSVHALSMKEGERTIEPLGCLRDVRHTQITGQ
jgi:hypothetical protein